ncbi:hypothetical protein Peur_059919 [Populus x canadensis]
MDEGMQQFQQSLVVENDKERNGNREALTALRKRAKTTKTSIKFPFESIMKVRIKGCSFNQEQLEYEAKNLQSFVKEKSLLISEKGVLADSISQRMLRSSVTLTDKPK